MPRLPPDHRGRAVLTDLDHAPPDEDAYAAALRALVVDGVVAQPAVEDAYAIYAASDYRHVLNACLLAKASDEALGNGLDFTPTMLAAYRHLFFDREVFRHALDVAAYVRSLTCTPDQRATYEAALQQGAAPLVNRFRIGERPALDPREALRTLLADQFERALAHRGQQLSSEMARDALTWSRAAVHTAGALLSQAVTPGTKEAVAELRIALAVRDHTAKAVDVGVDVGELVRE